MSAINRPHIPSLRLFREALRVIRLQRGFGIPTSTVGRVLARNDPHRRKLASNLRQLYELYREESDPKKVEHLIEMGRHDLEVLRALAKADELGLGRRTGETVGDNANTT
ncbi:uncharacterized protein SPPG_01191 [Spizellomyces punctatus DAOM BR117]|uniref:Uncharacterized protein n=1 Tax=Spizellomyces punctatus (strain DAOM BR117) TaxID=645134 RepID=A0A0L0HRL7_SPIPD|nr:uncharacterized protein SPPG_01191 [Spizellomyces punctatus DAOM BR117]KND03733.1 hypothetical protein SPPG_01191 [Spizellomyces punctatus DAOM BR117]|eukprot:XP_016611772.1 hypothetical protein SPPG_01191 [Spizellomyces punctatus DAOM BR117]